MPLSPRAVARALAIAAVAGLLPLFIPTDGQAAPTRPAAAKLLSYRVRVPQVHRQATGAPADTALVKKLAVELYLAPKREPDLATLDLPLARLARKWLLRGVFGRNTRRAAENALDAAERLDLDRVLTASTD